VHTFYLLSGARLQLLMLLLLALFAFDINLIGNTVHLCMQVDHLQHRDQPLPSTTALTAAWQHVRHKHA
jgi:hypothetical protein